LQAKKAEAKLNLTRLKRRDELLKRNGEAQMKMLKIKQE